MTDSNPPQPHHPFTKAQRIQQLSDIDKSITQLLHSATLALRTLSSSTKPTNTSSSNPNTSTTHTVAERKAAFQQASETYLTTLQTADVNLKRQIWGLEEADIIPAEIKVKEKEVGSKGKVMDMREMGRGGGEVDRGEGGMGRLDIGVLNSRGNKVERGMEGELWERGRRFLEAEGGEDVEMEGGEKEN